MVHLIDKDRIVAEIERQIELLKPFLGACAGQIVAEANDKLSVLEGLKNFLDTLEVKKVDLDKEIRRYRMNNPIIRHREESLYDYMTNVAKHFFELGMQVSNKVKKG